MRKGAQLGLPAVNVLLRLLLVVALAFGIVLTGEAISTEADKLVAYTPRFAMDWFFPVDGLLAVAGLAVATWDLFLVFARQRHNLIFLAFPMLVLALYLGLLCLLSV